MKGWRTRILSGVIGTLGILEASDLSFIPDQYEGYITIGIAIAVFWLRQITTTAPGRAE